jgi:hypothetical protein
LNDILIGYKDIKNFGIKKYFAIFL